MVQKREAVLRGYHYHQPPLSSAAPFTWRDFFSASTFCRSSSSSFSRFCCSSHSSLILFYISNSYSNRMQRNTTTAAFQASASLSTNYVNIFYSGTYFTIISYSILLAILYRGILCDHSICYAMVLRPSVCLSVCPSKVRVVSKRLKISSRRQHCMIAQEHTTDHLEWPQSHHP